jgi:diguanylate cyclase (GGDEF)-like protein
VKPGLDALQQLADLAARGPASRLGLTRIADTLREALGAERVCFVYAEGLDWLRCGDSRCGDEIGTGEKGLWLVQQRTQKQKAPVAFSIQAGRVEGLVSAAAGQKCEYLGIRIPTRESPAEMVIVRGPWDTGLDHSLLTVIEAARPSLIMFLERMLNARWSERQRQQMSALANAAEVLTQGEDTQSLLENLAGAISDTTGYEIVRIEIWDNTSQRITTQALNSVRWQGTGAELQLRSTEGVVDGPLREAIRTRQPVLMPDLQHCPIVAEEERRQFQWVMLVSAARVPILFADEMLGLIALASFRPRTFPPEEVEGFKAIATQLAVGLKARSMYSELAESKKQLERFSKRLQESTEIQHRLARTDALTGIPNRRYVEEVIEAERARALRHGGSLSVGLLDVDKLKSVNDQFGHDAGDEVLLQLARLARQSCRKGDVVGRYGGDEFLFVLPEADLGAARRFGERFRSRVEKQPFYLPRGDTLGLNVSLGVAEADFLALQEAQDLIATADAALYEAKSSGGNIVCSRSQGARVA